MRFRSIGLIAGLLAVLAIALPQAAMAAEPDIVGSAVSNTLKTVKSGQFAGHVSANAPNGGAAIDIKVNLLFNATRSNDMRLSASYDSTTGPGPVKFVVAKNKIYVSIPAHRIAYVVPLASVGIHTPPYKLPDGPRNLLEQNIVSQITNWTTDGADAVDGTPITDYSGAVDLNRVVTEIVPSFGFLPLGRALTLPGLDKTTVDYVTSILTGGVPARAQFGVDGSNLIRMFGVNAALTYPGGQGTLTGRFEFTKLNQNIKIAPPSAKAQMKATKTTIKKLNSALNNG